MNNDNKIRIGSKLKLGDGDIYEITDIYFTIEENRGQYQAYVDFKDENGIESPIALFIVLEMLQMDNLYRPESKLSQEYYEKIVKNRVERNSNLFKIN